MTSADTDLMLKICLSYIISQIRIYYPTLMTAILYNKSTPSLVVPGTILEYLVIKNKKIRNMYIFTSARTYIQFAFLGENSHMEI